MASYTPTRRALFGAIALTAAAPVAALVPLANAAPSRTAWDSTFARYSEALAKANRDSEEDQLWDEEHEQWCVLMMLPAPDPQALMWKLDYLFNSPEDGYGDGWAMKIINVVKADVRRLTGMEA